LDDQRRKGQRPVVVDPWKQPSISDIKPPEIEPAKERLTWYVGEY